MASTPTPPTGAWMKRLAVVAAMLVIAGLAAFYFASQRAQHDTSEKAADAVTVTITARTCEPNELTVPAGRATFRIVNASERAVEWEILDGVMVVEERENIAPGFSQLLTAKLSPGTYAITCGLLSNPRGTLTVTPSAEAAAEAAAGPSPLAFIGPLAEYKVYLAMESAELADAVRSLADAVKTGDVAEAQALYAQARVPYKHMQPVVDRIADLDTAIDARADYFERREDDSGFTGFHRLEYGLFARGSTEGLGPVADRLQADVDALQTRLMALAVSPEALAEGAARVIAVIADQKLPAGDNRYSHTDLADFQATVDGSRKIVDLLRGLATEADAQAMAAIDAAFADVEATLARYGDDEAFESLDRLSETDRTELAGKMRALAAAIGKLNTALGLG